MRSLKLAGVVACGLAFSVTSATAAPQVLDDAALDGVVAGFEISFPGLISESGFGIDRPPLGSLFPVPAPVLVLEIVIPLEKDGDTQSTTTGAGLVSTSETTGIPAEEFFANPPTLPRFPRFTFQ
jgi:hypothetical protein